MNAATDPRTPDSQQDDTVTVVQWLSIEQVSSLGAVSRQWIVEHVQAGQLTLPEPEPDPERWVFPPEVAQRVRTIARIEHQFDADPELAALVADLQEELARLRARVGRWMP